MVKIDFENFLCKYPTKKLRAEDGQVLQRTTTLCSEETSPFQIVFSFLPGTGVSSFKCNIDCNRHVPSYLTRWHATDRSCTGLSTGKWLVGLAVRMGYRRKSAGKGYSVIQEAPAISAYGACKTEKLLSSRSPPLARAGMRHRGADQHDRTRQTH